MNIKEFAQKFIEAEKQAFQQGNFKLLEQLESPNIILHMPPAPDFKGFEAHKQYITAARETTTNLQQEWDYITGDGNVCVLSFKETLTTKVENPLWKIPAGATINADALFVLRVENGKLAEVWIKGSYTTK
jgi:hypothetical protein